LRVLLFMLGICVGIVGVGTHAEAQNYPWFTVVAWVAAAQTAAPQHFNNALTPRAGSVASANRTHNISPLQDHIHQLGIDGVIRIERNMRNAR
jgi:hypothetical protein